VSAGQLLTYSITVSNAGPDAAPGVRLVDILSKRVAFVAADSPTCTPTGRRVICNLGTLEPGASLTLSIQGRPARATRPYRAVNTVTVGKRESDSRLANNRSREGTRVESPPPVLCAGRPADIVGTTGDDDLIGTNGPDVIASLGGSDHVVGLGGNDIVCGSGGDDTIRGSGGNDTVRGGGGNDLLKGGDGADSLLGKGGDDELAGGRDNDVLRGGGGNDGCRGGGGGDIKRSC
jgi:uncharacterized repeat protein (TIGR01451 family)